MKWIILLLIVSIYVGAYFSVLWAIRLTDKIDVMWYVFVGTFVSLTGVLWALGLFNYDKKEESPGYERRPS